MSDLVTSVVAGIVDLSAGTITTSVQSPWTNASARISSVGNGWYRVSLTATSGQGTLVGAVVFLEDGSGNVSYTGDGTSGLYIWGAQLEAGAFPTSYIPTTTAAATRAADSAVVTPISSFYNQAEGTLFAEVDTPAIAGGRDIVTFNNNTVNNWIGLRWAVNTQAQFAVVDNANTQVSIALSGYTVAGIYKRIGAYKVDDFAQSINGASVATDTSGTIPVLSHLLFASAGGAATLNGHIRKIAYWPKRLSNTLLQQLTT